MSLQLDYTRHMTNLDQSQIRNIVKDLSEKYPKGPLKRLEPMHYRKAEAWSDAYKRYVPTVALSSSLLDPELIDNSRGITKRNINFFGYEPLDLYRISADWYDEAHAKKLVRSIMPELQGPKLTRRTRLFWTRVKPSIAFIKHEGTEGIWRVAAAGAKEDNTSMWREAYFYGVSKADVESQVRLIGPMTGFKPEWSLSVAFDRLGTRDEAMQLLTSHVTERVNSLKRSLDQARRNVANIEAEYEKANSIMSRNMAGAMLLTNNEEQEVAE